MPNKNGHGPKRAILYARVSTEEQAKSDYSILEQLRELRSYAAREGYRVIEVAVDDGHGGADPHRPGLRRVMELARLLEPPVAARLDDASLYGLWTWNTRKTTRRKVWDADAGEFRIRYHCAPRPREEWLFVPVPDADIPQEVVQAARQRLEENARKPSKADKRF